MIVAANRTIIMVEIHMLRHGLYRSKAILGNSIAVSPLGMVQAETPT